MDDREKQIVGQMTQSLTKLLGGEKPEPICHENYPEPLKRMVKNLNETMHWFFKTSDFIMTLLKIDVVKNKDFLNHESITFIENQERRFSESESRYVSTVKNSREGIFIIDPLTMKVIESNEQFNSMMGYSQKEISKLTFYDFYSDHNIAQEDLKNVLGKTLNTIVNQQYRLKNGEYINVDINSCWATSGQSSVIILSVQDVNERNKSQEILAKYKVLLENARDIILFVSLDGRIIEANKAAEDAYGYVRDELILLSIYDLYRRDDRLFVERNMKEASLRGITFETIHIRKDRIPFPVEISSQGIVVGKEIILGKVIRDISDRKRIEDNLRFFASHDALTRVPNRYVLEETFHQTIAQINRENKTGALLLIDVDNFKFINDTFGHTIGDMVLIDLVSILKENLREEDLLARLGGDEFAVLLNRVTTEEASIVAEKLRSAVEKTKLSSDNYQIPYSYTISIGVAPIQNGLHEFRDVISRADFALYQSKEQGRNRISCASNQELGKDILSETNGLILTISDALKTDKFVLFFQPIVDVSSGETIHHEALMRIILDSGELIYPDKIIPIAERFGLMSQIDKLVIKLSFKALKKYPTLKLFVNLSGVSIGDEELLLLIEDNLQQSGIEPFRLGLEITETMAVKDLVRADRWIRRLKEQGCRFALDDFGMGFSSFSYLQYLSVDYVKIDGSYVYDLDKNSSHRALVQAMNTIARSLGKYVIAEFVENSSILDILSEDQVSHAQGYYLGYPESIPKLSTVSIKCKQEKVTLC